MTDILDALTAHYASESPKRLKPVPILRGEGITLSKAQRKHGVHPETARRWCQQYLVGQQWGERARWTISEPALRMIKDGNWQALSLLRHGAREDSPIVRPYLFNDCE